MAKGYVIFTEAVSDADGYQAYLQKALPTVFESGGRPMIADDNPETIEGEWHGPRTVVLEFDSVQAARDWYDSSEYRAIVGERHASAEANAVIVSGLD